MENKEISVKGMHVNNSCLALSCNPDTIKKLSENHAMDKAEKL